jgi:hypothetical protein
MPTFDLTTVAIFLIGLAFGCFLLIFIFSLFNVPNDIPVYLTDIIEEMIAVTYAFDFILPVKLMFSLFALSLSLEIGLVTADGALFAWKQIAKIKS